MPEQIPLVYIGADSDELVLGTSNQKTVDALRRPKWATGRIAVIGAASSGKTALANQLVAGGARLLNLDEIKSPSSIVDTQSRIVIDDVDEFLKEENAEVDLFHLINQADENKIEIAVFSTTELENIPIGLADLRSRLGTFEVLAIGEPDDEMVIQLLAKGFAARGIFVKPDVIAYLAKRIVRSYEEIAKAINALDHMALQEQGKVNKKRVKDYLDRREGDNSIS